MHQPNIPKNIRKIISEWTYEGHSYLYDEQPDNMSVLEDYLDTITTHVDKIYRRTDYHAILNAKVGDLISMNRVTSWSFNKDIPDAMYEGMESVLITIKNDDVRGVDVTDISFYKEEEEILLAPCLLYVETRDLDVLKVSYMKT